MPSSRSPARRLIAPAIATVIVFVILCGLGTWQWQRLGWKEALIAHVNARLGDVPVPAPGPAAWPGINLDDLDFTPVTVSGTFLNQDETYLYTTLSEPRSGPKSGVGWSVFVPLRTDAGWIVYVNRGFVPDAQRLPASRPGTTPEGPETVTGILRKPETPGMFQSRGTPEKGEWFAREPSRFAAAAGLDASKLAPFSIDADAKLNPGNFPQGGETLVVFPNNHLQYLITWYGLALALVAVFVAWARGVLRGDEAS